MDYIDRLSAEEKRSVLVRQIVRIVVKVVVSLLIIYLAVSAVYTWQYIDFGEPQVGTELLGQGYVGSENAWRAFMGLPKITTTYRGVPPAYLISVAARLIAALGLMIWLIVDTVKWWKQRQEREQWKNRINY